MDDIAISQYLADAINRLGWKLFQMIAASDERRNFLISPYSIGCALCMVYNGAKGETAEVIRNVLELESISIEDINRAFLLFNRTLVSALGQTLTSGNGIWTREDIIPKASFVAHLHDSYGAIVSDLSGGVEVINEFIRRKTFGQIKQVMNQNDLAIDIILILVNVLCFDGRWKFEFEPSATSWRAFHLLNSPQKACKMMHQTEKFAYYRNANLQMVSLPYAHERLEMVLLRPANSLQIITESLSQEQWSGWIQQMESCPVRVGLPLINNECQFPLVNLFEQLGVKTIFNPDLANFHNAFTEDLPVWIADFVHATAIKVDEKGTKASATTFMMFPGTSDFKITLPESMILDVPFLYIIRDNIRGVNLFLGRIIDPA